MGIWEDIKQELGIVKTAPYIFCFGLGCLLTWAVDARTLSNLQADLAACEMRVSARDSEFDAFLKKLDAAVINGMSVDPKASEGLKICRQLIPVVTDYSADLQSQAAKELIDNGCGETTGTGCKIPAITELLDGFLDMRDEARAAMGFEPIKR